MNNEGVILKKLRKENNYTQEQIANYLQIDQGLVSKIEKGERNLNLNLLDKLSYLYNCSHEYILGKSDVYSPNKFAFRVDEKNPSLEIVAKMNQIMSNLKFLKNLD
ncbi:helix-turn-helix domain-containing protein [Methanobrevibacter sp. OttesenSCG-928-K11]|nr:helix-turn-helix domain-containing protein [Methanobrevibacter sp. OttesenSCG-928-K11]MDL2270324.1 helix-turn-helix domain-containing protein [Methanobrevibacter sp. OttesenSCG-928-I08]